MSNEQKYFRVFRDWMMETGQGDESKVFKVKQVIQSEVSAASDIIVLSRANGSDWQVFPHRGRFVAPFTLFIENQRFLYAKADTAERPGLKHIPVEYYSEQEAREEVAKLNKALTVIIAHETIKQAVGSLKFNAMVSRLYKDGTPMKGRYMVGNADQNGSGQIALHKEDNPEKIFWADPDLMVAVL